MPDRESTKPFAAFLHEARRGLLHEELSDALADVVAGVMKHGKTGRLTLTLTIKPEGEDAIAIADKYVASIPTPPAKPALYFADELGHMSRQRLNQLEMSLKGIDGGQSTPAKDSAEEGATV